MISPQQIRAARALLDWSQTQLSDLSGVSRASIKNIEKNITAPRKDSIDAIRKALEDHGIEFLPGNGVREKDQIVTTFEGEDAEEQLLNDIYQTMLSEEGGEVLISGLEEMDPEKNPAEYALAKAHLDRLTNIGVKERILVKASNSIFIAPYHWYKFLPSEDFSPVSIFVYSTKVAMCNNYPPHRPLIINNKLFADGYRQLFNFAWERAQTPEFPEKIL